MGLAGLAGTGLSSGNQDSRTASSVSTLPAYLPAKRLITSPLQRLSPFPLLASICSSHSSSRPNDMTKLYFAYTSFRRMQPCLKHTHPHTHTRTDMQVPLSTCTWGQKFVEECKSMYAHVCSDKEVKREKAMYNYAPYTCRLGASVERSARGRVESSEEYRTNWQIEAAQCTRSRLADRAWK
ncbi:unnamed protein product [Protopolystoma xenopodis]|uniref:Uncharacterized protein n=1 Tax=Protopolystoma xenopodis TaxID=117903 RepID=A0A3S5A1Q3_9PLAT|nr:unnamed protein product [Protopolystoma xenopodis]